MEPIIKVDNVSMCFNLSTEKHESLKEYLLAMVQGRLQYDEFYALKDVSLDRRSSAMIRFRSWKLYRSIL